MDNYRSLVESIRTQYAVKVLFFLGIPLTGYKSFVDFSLAHYPSAVLLLLLCLTLLAFLVALRVVKQPEAQDIVYKLFFSVFIVLLGAEITLLIGFEGKLNNIPWFYVFPLVVFNLYSYQKGAVLTIALLVITMALLYLFPFSLDTMQEALRDMFVQSVILITGILFFAERNRFNQQERLIEKQQTLTDSEKTLNNTNKLLQTENIQRKQIEKELLTYKEQLELLVKDRTSELEITNQRLVQEIIDREQVEKQRLKLENQLKQSQKMEAIGVLAGGIAHDFNNILGTILGYSELLLSKLSDGSEEEDYVNSIYQAGERAADLVSQILTFSRAEKPELKPLPFVPFLNEVINMTRATLPTTIEIKKNIQVDPAITILANKNQVHQIILNLCSNAAHAMQDDGGTLEIQLSEVVDPGKRYTPPLCEGRCLP